MQWKICNVQLIVRVVIVLFYWIRYSKSENSWMYMVDDSFVVRVQSRFVVESEKKMSYRLYTILVGDSFPVIVNSLEFPFIPILLLFLAVCIRDDPLCSLNSNTYIYIYNNKNWILKYPYGLTIFISYFFFLFTFKFLFVYE